MACAEHQPATSARPKAVLPNLLYATTYALNKSNTKRAIVGIDYVDGVYKPVVKLCSTGSPAKYVTLDANRWALISEQIVVMTAFFQNSYAFYGIHGNPSRVYMPGLDVIYKSTYGAKSICFEERPVDATNGTAQERVDSFSTSGNTTNNNETHQSSLSSSSSLPVTVVTAPLPSATPSLQSLHFDSDSDDAACDSSIVMQPPSKKKRYELPPSVTFQEPTFIGLRDMHDCINTRLSYLTGIAIMVNRMIENIVLHLYKVLITDEAENAKRFLKEIKIFGPYIKANYTGCYNSARKAFESDKAVKEYTVNILLKEIIAFGLPWIAKQINDLAEKKFKNT